MKKRGISSVVIVILIILVVLLVAAGAYFYVAFVYVSDFPEIYNDIENPAEGLTEEQAIAAFDEEFVLYLLYNIRAYVLKNPPLSSDTPMMEIHVGNDIYNAEVIDREIFVEEGTIFGEDIVITTSKLEAVKMINDREYIQESFNNGGAAIELKAAEATLFAKGYLKIYKEVTGEVPEIE